MFLNEFIEKYPDFVNIHMIYLNRASAYSSLEKYEAAIKDYTAAYKIKPTYAEAVRQRGYAKKIMGKLEAALEDYNLALQIDPGLASTYTNKGIVLEALDRPDDACENYKKALELGMYDVPEFIEKSCDSTSKLYQKYTYQLLVDKSTDKTYGFTEENPIRVGHGPRGQEAFLKLLRDGQGNEVTYTRLGSCCRYSSSKSAMGFAMLDSYEVKYKDEKGKKKKVVLYTSFYEYDAPRIPVGFYSIQDFEKKK